MISAVVLAAGRSRRMGTQKLLLPVAGQPLICHVVDQVLAAAVEELIVVTRTDGRDVTKALANRNVRFVTNPNETSEMIDSVRCGLVALPASCEATLIVLGDQPGVTTDVVNRLIRTFREQDRGIVVPTFGGRRGHPLLIATHYRDDIVQRYDEVGLRGLLQSHPQDVIQVEIPVPGILEDVDDPSDYERVVKAASQPPA